MVAELLAPAIVIAAALEVVTVSLLPLTVSMSPEPVRAYSSD